MDVILAVIGLELLCGHYLLTASCRVAPVSFVIIVKIKINIGKDYGKH